MPAEERVGIIGAGSWGTTLAKIAAEGDRDVMLWARHDDLAREINEKHENSAYLADVKLPKTVVASADLQEVCERCAFLLLVVPSHGLRQVARTMGDFVDGEHVVVHCTKGLEQKTHKRMTEVLREETCLRKIGVLSGPNLAKELAAGRPAGTLVASRYDEVYQRGCQLLCTDYFRVYSGSDVVGAEVGGFFKNIVAVAAGAVDGLGLGDNTKALLLTRGMNEMARLGVAMGAKMMTFFGMAGFGDLMATCASPFSRNHQVGERLAKGQGRAQIEAEMKMVAEGVKSTQAVYNFARELALDLPIVTAVHRVLYEGANVPDALNELMARQAGSELAGLEGLSQ